MNLRIEVRHCEYQQYLDISLPVSLNGLYVIIKVEYDTFWKQYKPISSKSRSKFMNTSINRAISQKIKRGD